MKKIYRAEQGPNGGWWLNEGHEIDLPDGGKGVLIRQKDRDYWGCRWVVSEAKDWHDTPAKAIERHAGAMKTRHEREAAELAALAKPAGDEDKPPDGTVG